MNDKSAPDVDAAQDDLVTLALTEAEAARLLGLATQTLRNRRSVQDPRVPRWYRNGRSIRYELADVLEFKRKNFTPGRPGRGPAQG